MALSMDEQRVLAEIERRLAEEDPGLAKCMTSFKRPGPAAALRSPRARIIGSLFTVMVVAVISLMAYALVPFRGHVARTPPTGRSATMPGRTAFSASGNAVADRHSAAPGVNAKAPGAADHPAAKPTAAKPGSTAQHPSVKAQANDSPPPG
jgi:Protein of unknown function (DUF3040)